MRECGVAAGALSYRVVLIAEEWARHAGRCGIAAVACLARVSVDCRPGGGQHQVVPDVPSESRDDG
jgi:hypothetical protein